MPSEQPRRPRVWGHRGAMAFAPQNTLPSFLLARDQGADGVELDVQLTRDGVPVVFHDARVDALTDGRGPISTLTWAQVRALDAGIRFGPAWRNTRIPTLGEVLEALGPGMTVNVELKTALSEATWVQKLRKGLLGPRKVTAAAAAAARAECGPLAAAVAPLVRDQPPGRIVLSSFDPFALEAIAPLAPGVPLGFLHAPSVPWDTPALAAALGCGAWHPHHSQVTAEAVAREHAAGRRVHVWTVNDPAHGAALAALGVDALITNRPGDILRALGG